MLRPGVRRPRTRFEPAGERQVLVPDPVFEFRVFDIEPLGKFRRIRPRLDLRGRGVAADPNGALVKSHPALRGDKGGAVGPQGAADIGQQLPQARRRALAVLFAPEFVLHEGTGPPQSGRRGQKQHKSLSPLSGQDDLGPVRPEHPQPPGDADLQYRLTPHGRAPQPKPPGTGRARRKKSWRR